MTRITEIEWTRYFGFQRFPFDRPEAGNEDFARPEFLASCFVYPRGFDRIVGQADNPVSTLLFAERGNGKTACRVMLDYSCQHKQVRYEQDKQAYVLSVPHIHLYEVLSAARRESQNLDQPAVRVEHHAAEVLRRAIVALAELLSRVPELRDRVRGQTSPILRDLSSLILVYGHYLTSEQRDFLYTFEAGPRLGFKPRSETSINPLLINTDTLQAFTQISPLEHLRLLTTLMPKIGVPATYALVDGVDEFEDSASDPRSAYRILRPLLTHLQMMDGTPYFALKFFLPSFLKPFMDADEAVRHDRGFAIESLSWSEKDLIEIIRRRLDTVKSIDDSSRGITPTSFDDLCVPELRGQIELDLSHWANGNPRHMMIISGLMVTAHCAQDVFGQDDPYQLNRADWKSALEQFELRVLKSGSLVELDSTLDLRELIMRGENEQLEFKSSLKWDYKTQAVNKVLIQVIAKTLAGMLNSEGGILLVGVSDEGEILGLQKDLQSLSKPNSDGFRLALTDAIKTYLGLEYMKYVRVSFEELEDKLVCMVSTARSDAPVFFASGEVYEFWVRFGNSTRSLDVRAATNYIQMHWRND